ncbi:nuclear transport factor 2 family protein [Flagellimonas olearia]|uniref:Nuclear transport factor 2 family protein n=1 Tax=Flagellimonas olearia TaxID=552546 RepID=A0A6I1E704_9FLAO|nr:nuclear transport factor 2 family protein [Allomuricauda olearia]KAB7531715.1 nuclear transport factor 2 family protein [Allomuricauda olearia]
MNNKEIVKQVIEAFLKHNVDKALSFMADDIKMGWPGFFNLKPGKDAIREFYQNVPQMISSEIGEFIEEGNKVVGTGVVTARHGDGSLKKSFFADVYMLENGKVKEIKSYMVFEQSKEA